MPTSRNMALSLLLAMSAMSCSFEVPDHLEFSQNVADDAEPDGVISRDAGTLDSNSSVDIDVAPTPCEPEVELCNREDDDCDGAIDEDFPALGESCVVNMGLCEVMGQLVCEPTMPAGAPLTCSIDSQPPAPQAEQCDGLDNDCDGESDEALTRDCYEGPEETADLGVCQRGTQTCTSAEWGLCEDQVTPSEEQCNDLDDDCDDETDEALSRACYGGPDGTAGVGECAQGEQLCSSGSWRACRNETTPVAERCNGRDDDCDGRSDEAFANLGDRCAAGVGACRASGEFVCTNDEVRCDAALGAPIAELCDGLDNDCDGDVDEAFDLVNRCIVGIGECARSAVPVCRDDGRGARCPVSPGAPVTEGIEAGGAASTCDGYDNDCDGRVDEQNLGCCINGEFDAACIASLVPGAP